MSRRLLAGLVAAALLAASLTTPAQEPEPPVVSPRFVSLSFSSLGLPATRVTSLASDRTNQVWLGTNEGVSGVQGDRRAPFFPFRTNDGLLANDVRAVTFGFLGNDENFFLGFPNGIQYGRLLSTSGLSLAGSLVAGAAQDSRNLINDLATDGASTVWAATGGGLVEWDISGQAPILGNTFLAAEAPFVRVAVEPLGADRAAVASAGRDIFLVRTTSSTSVPDSSFTAATTVADLAFDPDGHLWALTAGREVLRFNSPSDSSPFPTNSNFRIDASLREMRALGVDPFTSTVWVGTDLGAYFQTLQAASLASRICTESEPPGIGCWALDTTPNFTRADRVDRVYVDPAGNIWFGTNGGLKGRVFRLLLLNNSTYLGAGAQVTVSLEDRQSFAENGAADTATILVTVGSATETLEAAEEGDTGRFTFTFQLADLADVPGSDGVDIKVEYTFLDPQGEPRSLPAEARWANIVPFEDDLWLGGLCFLEALRR